MFGTTLPSDESNGKNDSIGVDGVMALIVERDAAILRENEYNWRVETRPGKM